MSARKPVLSNLITCCLLLWVLVPQSSAADNAAQALLHIVNDGTLSFEAAFDQNITFRLMGDASALLLNDFDLVSLLRRRRRALAAATAPTTVARREPLSLDALKEQFRGVQRDMARLARWLGIMHNGTRRNGLNQRVLRRSMQRVQVMSTILSTMELNLRRDDCRSSPCKNGGTCFDAYMGFHCSCAAGWQGSSCEDDVNECSDLANTELGACMNDAQCVNTPGSYRCVCRAGFSGTHCRLRQNACLANQSTELCGSHGTCLAATNSQGFVCICDQGWTWADTNVSAASPSPCSRDVDECAPEVNPCHNECINLPGSFRCGACAPGYTGDGKYCRDLDECADGNNGGCSQRPRVACINTEGSYRCGRCPPGWEGDGRTCSQAKSSSCNGENICHSRAQCEYISGTVVCSCPAGFYGHGYGADGCTEDSSRRPCDQHPCQNNGTCVLSGRGTSCICQPGYMGAVCASADACHPNPCQNDGTCKLLPNNQYQCMCPTGFTGSRCSHLRSFCGTVLRNTTGSLQFPPSGGSGQEYQPNERCAFIIRTQRGMVLNVTFGMFDLEPSNDCSADFLQLHDGSSLTARFIGRFCGQELPLGNGSVVSTQEQLFLWFRSDNSTQARGFNLTWRSQASVCGAELSLQLGQSGVIRSPGYPGKTRPGVDCRWELKAPFSSRMVLRFYEINLGLPPSNQIDQLDEYCNNGDFLRLRDAYRQLYVACQSAQPAPLYTSTSWLNVHFHTDNHYMDSSFQLHYEVVPGHPGCGGFYTEPRGLLSGANLTDELCLYLIEQPTGTQIQLDFQLIDLTISSSCSYQKIEIFDGRTQDSPLLKQFCGNPSESELQPLVSTGNVILVRCENKLSGISFEWSFQLRYTRVCSFTHNSGIAGGIITTPGYPKPYIEDIDCSYNIYGPPNTIASLTILDLSLSRTEPPLSSEYLGNESGNFITNQSNYLDLISENNHLRMVFHGVSNTQNGRGLRAEYTFKEIYCGGVLTEPSKQIQMAIRRGLCQWVIEVPGPKILNIRILILYPLAGTHLTVYDNSTSGVEGRLLVDTQIQPKLPYEMKEYTDSSLLTISVLTDDMLPLFRLSYGPSAEECGGVFQTRYGSIKSPNWPANYGSMENCTWIIKAPFDHKIELVVHNFTMEPWFSYGDYLEIRNGATAESPLIGRYPASDIPARIPSSGNALYLHFESDSYMEYEGFYFHWQMVATGCGGKLTSHVGAIHSPHNTEANLGRVACDWQIIVAQGSTVNLQLESRNDVCNGQLTLFDGPNIHSARLPMNCSDDSSNQQTILLRSTGNRVLVRYVVGPEAPDGLNFVLEYSTNCKVQLDQLSGIIETPNFPDNFPPDSFCEWNILADGPDNRIQLALSHLSIEIGFKCKYHSVRLLDYQDQELIGQRSVCSARNQGMVTSKGNRLVVKFENSYSNRVLGFHAEYKRLGCGEVLQGASGGRIETPNAPFSNNLNCHWKILAPVGYQIRLVLHEVHIELPQLHNCSQDELTIRGDAGAPDVLWRSCRVESAPQTFVSPANELNIRFVSSPQRARKYVKASYAIVPASCGGQVSARTSVIASPNYYDTGLEANEKDVECTWNLRVEEAVGIIVIFQSYNLTNSTNCQQAMLELSSREFTDRFCGDGSKTIRSTNNAFLKFQVSAGARGKFLAKIIASCSGTLTDNEGYIRSQLDSSCYWKIIAPEGSKISLNILQLECPRCTEPAGNCTSGLRVFNDEDDVLYYSLCEKHTVDLIVPANQVRIEAVGIVLSAKYSTIRNSCGGSISSARGILSSPSYPDTYPANIECVWELELRAGNAIELSFDALDMPESEHCNEDFLELRAGMQGSLLGLYCGKQLPDEPIVSNSSLWLKFRSVPGSSGNGFKLRWSYVHDIELTGLTNGTIESPPTLAVQGDDRAYTWRIFTKREWRVVLDFKEYSTGLSVFDGFDDTAIPLDIGFSPFQVISSSNVLFLRSVNANFDDFRLQWHVESSEVLAGNVSLQNEGCGQQYTVNRLARVDVTSPGFPQGYGPDLSCEWIFKTADPSYHLFVELNVVRLEAASECQFDYLSIQSSSSLLDWSEQLRLCNSSASELMSIGRVHGSPNLKLTFKSDATINGTGFRAVVRPDCGANMTESVGTIVGSSLQRIENAALEGFCEWHIEVRPGRVIEIAIEYEESPMNSSCPHYGLIYDGMDASAQLLENGKFCNQLGFNRAAYRTSGPHATIRYFMPAWIRRKNPAKNNWTLTYREFRDCDNEVRLTQLASSYIIETPGYPYYPHPHTDCTWTIVAPIGETIAANFVGNFDLSARHCEQEFVELFDGTTMLSRRLLHTCRQPATIRSSGNLLLVHYQTELNEPHAGFKLNVSLSLCGGQVSGYSGTITSEHYPALGAYPTPATCEYLIKVPHNSHIKLSILDLHLPFSESATATSFIEFFDVNDQRRVLQVVYGNISSLPYDIVFATNELGLRFVALNTSSHSFRGFKVKYSSILGTCYRYVTAAAGQLQIPTSVERGMWPSRHCEWHITVPKGQRVRLEMLNLHDLMSSRHTFSLYNDKEQQSKITEFRAMGYNGSHVFESSDNFMLFHIYRDSTAARMAIRARFTSNEVSACPPDIDIQAVGTLTNQELLQSSQYYCTVKFRADQTLVFSVEELSINPALGRVTIVDDKLSKATVLTPAMAKTSISLSTLNGHFELLQRQAQGLQSLRITYRRYPCGNTFYVLEGNTIELPQLSSHFGVLECVWKLENSRGYQLDGNVTLSDSCDREYLVISSYTENIELVRICRGVAQLNTTLLQGRSVKVLYHATAYQAGGNSQFRLWTSKPQSLVRGNSIVQLRYRPSSAITVDSASYKHNMELSWQFATQADKALRLEFQGRFFIEQAPNCSHDQLQVQSRSGSGLWNTEATLCGRDLPQPVSIQSHQMRVIFRTNGNNSADGFTFVVHPTCDIKLRATRELQALHRNRLFSQSNCNIEISTDTKDQLLVSVKSTRSDRFCRYSHFEAYRQEDGQERLIDGHLCPDFEVNGYGRIRITYDALILYPFHVEYQLIGCGGNYTAPFTLRSPLRSIGQSSEVCAWHVLAPPQHAVFVHFKYLEMLASDGCEIEDVSIYQGDTSIPEQRVSRLCGNRSRPFSIMVDSNQALFEAQRSVSYVSGRTEFTASVEFTPNCNERLALSEGNSRMSLVRHYQLNRTERELHCYFWASAPSGHRMSVWIKQLQLQNSTQRCVVCNSLELVDGFDDDSPTLGTYYTVVGNGSRFFSSTQDVLIKLSAFQSTAESFSFELILEMATTVCGQLEYELQGNESVRLRLNSGNVSSNYEGHVHCAWHFMSAREMEIEVHTVLLPDVSQSTGKCRDYLLMPDSTNSNHYYCGQFNNTIMTIPKGSGLNLIFHTAAEETTYILDITVRVKSICNRIYNSLDGVIHYYAEVDQDLKNCSNEIRVPEGYSIVLELDFLQLEPVAQAMYFNLTDLKTNRTLYNTTDYFSESSLTITSRTNAVRIASLGARYLKLYYHSNNPLSPGCGGQLRSASGLFSSPDYNNRNYSECIWDLTVPAGLRLSFTFRRRLWAFYSLTATFLYSFFCLEFDMGPDSNCDLDNVKFYELLPDNTQLLRHNFCGQNIPESFNMNASRLKIIAMKSPNFDGTGFRLAYDQALQ
ncbi:hypothetical protein KR222_005560 [Zaprionus bogoriensis]|nr:hypothetical protein KR222_005560 [Zaprionus bogoriensis]